MVSIGFRQYLGCLAMLVVLVGGCAPEEEGASKVTQRNFDKIRSDMKREDLVELLGDPTECRIAGPSLDARWMWIDGERQIEVVIEPNGHVLAHGTRVMKYAKNLERPSAAHSPSSAMPTASNAPEGDF